MNTPAHLALSLAVLGRRSRRGDWWWIGAGALLPDVFLYVAHFARGRAGADWTALNASLSDAANSFPLWSLILALAFLLGARGPALLAGSALLHLALDLPLHATDAHLHFWPLTDWRFRSPLSFWDADRHGAVVGMLEGVLFLVCWVAIWRRLDRPLHRAAALALFVVYAAAFVHFAGHVFAGRHWAIW